MIGDQTWMAENLKVTRYSDGSAISLVKDNSDWSFLGNSSKAYCWYDSSSANRDKYGGLYTWAATMNGAESSNANPSGIQGVCPSGWHIPSDEEWKELEIYLAMSQEMADYLTQMRGLYEGGKLKETGTSSWDSPNREATNESGFTARANGLRNSMEFSFFKVDMPNSGCQLLHLMSMPYIVIFTFLEVILDVGLQIQEQG